MIIQVAAQTSALYLIPPVGCGEHAPEVLTEFDPNLRFLRGYRLGPPDAKTNADLDLHYGNFAYDCEMGIALFGNEEETKVAVARLQAFLLQYLDQEYSPDLGDNPNTVAWFECRDSDLYVAIVSGYMEVAPQTSSISSRALVFRPSSSVRAQTITMSSQRWPIPTTFSKSSLRKSYW